MRMAAARGGMEKSRAKGSQVPWRPLASILRANTTDDQKVSVAKVDFEHPNVLDEVRVRSVRASIASSVAIIALVIVYALVPGHYPLAPAPYFVLVGVGALAVIISACLPWRALVRRRLFVPFYFTWSVADVALVSACIAVSGASHSDLYLIFLVMCVFMASASFPRVARTVLTMLLLISYVVTLAVVGWHIGTATILLRLGMIVVTAVAADIMSVALTHELHFRDQVTSGSEGRTGMWSSVDGLGRETGSLDENAVVDWAVNGVSAYRRRDALHFRSLVTSTLDAMVVMDTHGQIVDANHQIGHLLRYEPDELVGMHIESLMSESSRQFAELYRDTFTHNPRTLVVGDSEDMSGLRKDGSEFPMEVVLGPIDGPEGLFVTATVRDVTERRELKRRLAHQATHDDLTGLPNRAKFVECLAKALARTPVGSSQIAVCFLDVDHFKYVNDSRGHTIGDELVTEVARRIASTARAGDLVARFGGDEFAVLVEGLTDRQGAVAQAWRLLAAFDRPFVIEGAECYLSASMGIAFGARGDDTNDLLRDADAAMYLAKRRGRARVELFDDTLTARAVERLEIESALHQALLGEQLSLMFQPVMNLSDRSVLGVEALLRWEHPDRGLVPPLAFVPIAEESGLILQIGRWVLARACEHAARWTDQRLLPAPFTVSVNVSNRQLEHDGLIAEVATILESSGLPPCCLVVEITESFFIRDLRAAVRRLKALKQLGVRIAIDDFGTGFSSLNSLSRLPIDVVKIDKSFIDTLGTRNDAIVGAVIDVASAFDLEVIAEGVESEDQAQRLLGLGCAFAQGYLFGRPVPAFGIERMFSSRPGAAG
jgi:diguanylate cyclase (GGDEF)-like protein/PAS domain S-box-containing protein